MDPRTEISGDDEVRLATTTEEGGKEEGKEKEEEKESVVSSTLKDRIHELFYIQGNYSPPFSNKLTSKCHLNSN